MGSDFAAAAVGADGDDGEGGAGNDCHSKKNDCPNRPTNVKWPQEMERLTARVAQVCGENCRRFGIPIDRTGGRAVGMEGRLIDCIAPSPNTIRYLLVAPLFT